MGAHGMFGLEGGTVLFDVFESNRQAIGQLRFFERNNSDIFVFTARRHSTTLPH